MATAKDAKIQIELGQSFTDYAAMTDSGDHQIFTAGTIWSGKSGKTPVVRPNGMVTGIDVLSTHATNDTVTIGAFTAYSEGTLHSVTATTDTITRPATAVAKINSITMTDAGAIAVVAGTDGATTAFSETRGAAGGPPEIPADSVEIGQIRVTSDTAAAIAASEIFQVVGTHTERYDYPVWAEYNYGFGNAADSVAEQTAHIKFASALTAIHASAAYKKVYIAYYTPIFSDLARTMDFTAAETSGSVSSQKYYGGSVGSVSESLGAGAFTALLNNGVTDNLVTNKGQVLTVKFFPDENAAPYIITQGGIYLTRTFPAENQIQASVTIAAENASAEYSS